MRTYVAFAGLGLLGAAAGIVLAQVFSFPGNPASAARQAPPAWEARQVSAGAPRAAKDAVPEERGLARLLALQRGGGGPGKNLRREMERLGTEELRSRMVELVEAYGKEQRVFGLKDAYRMFGEELFRREGEAALEWAAGLDEKLRKPVLASILMYAAGESPAVAKRWIDELRKTYGAEWNSGAAAVAMRAAAQRGADDLLRVASLFGADLEEGPQSAPSYAEDFDFAKMLAEFPKGHGAREAFRYWTAKDKDAAWETMKTLFERKEADATLSMGAMWGGVAAVEGQEASNRWLLARLDEIPQDMRAETIGNLFRQNGMLPDDYEALVRSMTRQDDRLNFASGFFAAWGEVNEVHAVLRPLGHQERVDVMVKAAAGYSRLYLAVEEDRSRRIRTYFDERISEYSLGPEEAEKVRRALGGK